MGVDRVLFGTDSPLYHTGMQRARIDNGDFTSDEKRQILRDNAMRLFGLTSRA
jgi:predicted TIM-barrel fold metal-dependent hydrolase